MEKINTDADTTEVLLDLLKDAAKAHGLHEKELGKPDPDWPQWYAAHMTRTLAEAGFHLSRETGGAS